MSGSEQHSAFRAAAINAEATAAGAIDNESVLALIPVGETMAPADAVAALKVMKPHLFGPKPASAMTTDEYKAAKRKLLSDAELRRVGLTPKK